MESEPGINGEVQLMKWEKGLYASYGAALTLLVHAVIKAIENIGLDKLLLDFEEVTNFQIFSHVEYYAYLADIKISLWRYLLWLFIEVFTLGAAAILAFHPAQRRNASFKRLNVIFGYLLAGWITLLSLGAQFPNDNSIGYYAFVVAFLLAIGWGYWRSRRKRERAEEIFP
jgi:hypothetical protein